MKSIDALQIAIRKSAEHNPDVQLAPVCILWPDRDRQWEAVVPRLKHELPELFILGEYNPGEKTGPAIWLRCVIANVIEAVNVPVGFVPVLYLPGVSRQDLRAVDSCPDSLKPLAELQYRGVIWSQFNGKDWTVLAFIMSNQGGLGLDVAQDRDTTKSLLLAINRFLDEDLDLVKGKRLDKDYFNMLLSGGDPVRDLLHWLNDGDVFRTSRSPNEWRAFVEVCKSQFVFDPENDGMLVGSSRLASHEGPWQLVWERYCEAPRRYPNIPLQIRRTSMPADLFADKTGWPQWNDIEEDNLRGDLITSSQLPPHEARKRLKDLYQRHQARSTLVWAEIGEAPLACAIEWLSILAGVTDNSLSAGTIDDLVAGYSHVGWKADDALIRALSCVDKAADIEAVTMAIRSVYLSWAEDSARYLQRMIESGKYPGGTIHDAKVSSVNDKTCIVFVDGLRFDVAKRVAQELSVRGYLVKESVHWAALPSVTATAKPSVSPVRHLITGGQVSADFEPVVADTGQSLKGGYYFKKLLADAGWQVDDKTGNEDPNGHRWYEYGDIDHEGHDRGWQLAKRLNQMVEEILERIHQLLQSGWTSVKIVTDHGWLLVPGGLPKTELLSHLTENKWGRCAVIKPGAVTDERLYPWFWNPDEMVALADGISCYRSGVEYAHGGLSLQECLTSEITVQYGQDTSSADEIVNIDVAWKRLRCTVVVEGDKLGSLLDIRLQPGNANSSVVVTAKPFNEYGRASVVVENEDLEGVKAVIVIVDEHGQLIYQTNTFIGGGNE